MSPTPRQSIDPTFIQDLECPICGRDSLQVKSMERYPDYVACGNCHAQFVLEQGGERVMYGEIPSSYPRTRRFALQQWAWPEAIARRASEERPQAPSQSPSAAATAAEVPAEPPDADAETPPEPDLAPLPNSAVAGTEQDFAPESESADQVVDEEAPPWQPEAPLDAEAETAEEPELEETIEPDPADAAVAPLGDPASTEEEVPDLPEDLEPAPEMPEWLGDPGPDFADEPAEDEPAPAAEADEAEDMLAALWGEEEPEETAAPAEDPIEPAEADTETFAADLWDADETDEQPLPEFEGESIESESGADAEELTKEDVAAFYWSGETMSDSKDEPISEDGPAAAEGSAEGPDAAEEAPEREPIEPAPGIRHRVVLKSSQPVFPDDRCAHCTRTPATARMSVSASVVRSSSMGDRKITTFRLPICADCQSRVNTRSDEQQTARLQAHLISVLTALILVVGALAFGIADLQESLFVDLAVLGILALMGYAVPGAFLLLRASRMPKPADARFVETTLRVPGDTQGMETAYEWRSPEYAAHFLEANREVASGDVTKVRQRQYEAEEAAEANA